MDFRALRAQAETSSLRDIARQYWAGKRDRKERLIKIDGFDVLRDNNYTMEVSGGRRGAPVHHGG